MSSNNKKGSPSNQSQKRGGSSSRRRQMRQDHLNKNGRRKNGNASNNGRNYGYTWPAMQFSQGMYKEGYQLMPELQVYAPALDEQDQSVKLPSSINVYVVSDGIALFTTTPYTSEDHHGEFVPSPMVYQYPGSNFMIQGQDNNGSGRKATKRGSKNKAAEKAPTPGKSRSMPSLSKVHYPASSERKSKHKRLQAARPPSSTSTKSFPPLAGVSQSSLSKSSSRADVTKASEDASQNVVVSPSGDKDEVKVSRGKWAKIAQGMRAAAAPKTPSPPPLSRLKRQVVPREKKQIARPKPKSVALGIKKGGNVESIRKEEDGKRNSAPSTGKKAKRSSEKKLKSSIASPPTPPNSRPKLLEIQTKEPVSPEPKKEQPVPKSPKVPESPKTFEDITASSAPVLQKVKTQEKTSPFLSPSPSRSPSREERGGADVSSQCHQQRSQDSKPRPRPRTDTSNVKNTKKISSSRPNIASSSTLVRGPRQRSHPQSVNVQFRGKKSKGPRKTFQVSRNTAKLRNREPLGRTVSMKSSSAELWSTKIENFLSNPSTGWVLVCIMAVLACTITVQLTSSPSIEPLMSTINAGVGERDIDSNQKLGFDNGVPKTRDSGAVGVAEVSHMLQGQVGDLQAKHSDLQARYLAQRQENSYLREWFQRMHTEALQFVPAYKRAYTAYNQQLLSDTDTDAPQTMGQAYTVVVPNDVTPGTEFEVQVEDQVYVVTCPTNGHPGEIMAFDIPEVDFFADANKDMQNRHIPPRSLHYGSTNGASVVRDTSTVNTTE
eukprot:CAMPEP_0167754518 /NCGR_PEP_ID=MMETSP0110_2-20121227/8309_1 /TAXON_ID=629695 /ORGANISM="Gymnochlora sp., Strain CCMP2014" /LENGTH=772 /DNA_ID=CAMNT_0007640395 /DNA_START=121 /DNA_END=2439 /DNA_ORIENTATION=+